MIQQGAPDGVNEAVRSRRREPVVIVTGASRGVGKAATIRLTRAGMRVFGTYLSASSEAEQLATGLTREGRRVQVMRCDLTSPSSIGEFVQEVIDTAGRIDGLINNAGIWRGGRLVDLDATAWRSVVEADLIGVADLTRAVVRHMLLAQEGRIVNVSSIVGLYGHPGDTAYAAAKSGLIGFTQSLAKELASYGIAVNAVAPGPIATDMTARLPPGAFERLVDAVPARRAVTVDEVADVLTYLMAAPIMLTGAVIPIAGAMT